MTLSEIAPLMDGRFEIEIDDGDYGNCFTARSTDSIVKRISDYEVTGIYAGSEGVCVCVKPT